MPSPQGSRCELSYRDETFWLSRVDRSKVSPEWSEVSDEELIGAELDLTLHGRMPPDPAPDEPGDVTRSRIGTVSPRAVRR